MYHETILALEHYTDAVEFERLASDILSRLGYRTIEPQGKGTKDGGKDALLSINDDDEIVFHYSIREKWDKKLQEDLTTVQKNKKKYTEFVFVTNRHVTPGDKDKLKAEVKKIS